MNREMTTSIVFFLLKKDLEASLQMHEKISINSFVPVVNPSNYNR
jgi:hypothetical protein